MVDVLSTRTDGTVAAWIMATRRPRRNERFTNIWPLRRAALAARHPEVGTKYRTQPVFGSHLGEMIWQNHALLSMNRESWMSHPLRSLRHMANTANDVHILSPDSRPAAASLGPVIDSSSRGVTAVEVSAPAPIPYQGSKRKLAPVILACMPSDVETLYEPFCGSAAISLAALSAGLVGSVTINDSNVPLMRLWLAILEDPETLANQYELLWNAQDGREREFYDEVRSTFNAVHEPHLLLYLLARCVKAAVRYNGAGEFNQSPDNRRKGTKPERMRNQLVATSKLLQGKCEITHTDYAEAMKGASPDDLVYMDPPYQGVSTNRDRRYKDILSFESFVLALEGLNRNGISYIVSYDGRTADKHHGQVLPESLDLVHLHVDAGRSTQETLLGRDGRTVESLYLSAPLVDRMGGALDDLVSKRVQPKISA